MIYAQKKILNIGSIVKTHGVQGSMLLKLNAGYSPSIISDLEWCFFKIREKPVPFKIAEAIEIGPSEVILHLDDINSKPDAENYLNYEIAIERNKPVRKRKTDNINLLVGYKVYNQKKLVGSIAYIEDTGKQFLFVMDNDLLLPAHDDLIEDIDDKSKSIFMQLPEGLV